MYFTRTPLALLTVFALLVLAAVAQNKKLDPDAGYLPTVAPENGKKKKKADDVTQALALPPELPAAVTAETGRLTFQVTPLLAKGLLSQQTRDALKYLMHSSRGTIVKLRAFVAGSGDLRRIAEITGETFQEKHLPLPALTAVQVGALPLEGAQVIIEATEEDRKVVNPSGLGFFAAQPGMSIAESLAKLNALLASAGADGSDALLVTCFISSLDDQHDAGQTMAATFPSAALDYVQMQRGPVNPAAMCEATARLPKPAASPDAPFSLVSNPEIVITGTQLAFGAQDSDFKLALDRLVKTLAAKNAKLSRVVISDAYLTSVGLTNRVRALGLKPPQTIVPVEALPSLDAQFGLDVIAVPSSEE